MISDRTALQLELDRLYYGFAAVDETGARIHPEDVRVSRPDRAQELAAPRPSAAGPNRRQRRAAAARARRAGS